MGDVTAMLCVLIIDANRFHPATPIQRPGGALRAMTRRHAAGSLNLVGSLIGLERRLAEA
jgi:replication initiation protein RepC